MILAKQYVESTQMEKMFQNTDISDISDSSKLPQELITSPKPRASKRPVPSPWVSGGLLDCKN